MKTIPTIILVDDDVVDLELNELSIKRLGYELECISFTDPQQAIVYLASHAHQGSPALIISDMKMGSMTGYEFLHNLRARSLNTCPFILLSGIEEDRYEALRAGADAFYEKPINLRKSLNLFGEIIGRYVLGNRALGSV